METAFRKLVSGSAIAHIGLEMDEGKKYTQGTHYLYLDIPARDSDVEIKRNMHVFLEAASTCNVIGHSILLVEPNPALAEFGSVQPSYRVHPKSGKKQLGVWFTAHKQLDLSSLEYLVRLYLYV